MFMTARSPAIGLRLEMVDQLFGERLHATVARGLPASFVVSTTYLAPLIRYNFCGWSATAQSEGFGSITGGEECIVADTA